MRLKVQVPTEVIVDEDVARVSVDALEGARTFLPRHIDFVAALVPGILAFATEGKDENLVAIDEAVLVKRGGEVLISARRATRGPSLEELRQKVEDEFESRDEQERKSRSAALKLEADLVRRFLEVQESGG
jgi:F-type H+-transporting ATPase subunit epsilon